MEKQEIELPKSNFEIDKAKHLFMEISALDRKFNALIPNNNPHKVEIGNKLLDLLLRFRFVIDIEEAEISNPVKLDVKKKEVKDGAEQQSH